MLLYCIRELISVAVAVGKKMRVFFFSLIENTFRLVGFFPLERVELHLVLSIDGLHANSMAWISCRVGFPAFSELCCTC